MQLWLLFKYEELTEVVSHNSKLLVGLLNKVRLGQTDDDVEKILLVKFIHDSGENYTKDAFHIYTDNEPAAKMYEVILNNLSGDSRG